MNTKPASRGIVCLLALGFAPLASAESKAGSASSIVEANPDVQAPNAPAQGMLGTYVGAFGANKITICLQKVIGQTLNGYSVVAGNQRAFSGSIVEKDGALSITAREPGNNPEDGVFKFDFHPGTPRLAGTWTPNNTKKLEKKTFDLERRAFHYDPKAGMYPFTSTRALKAKDVENIKSEDLRVMRNEIYARHGYCFRMKDMRRYFDAADWYMPISIDVTNNLTPIEEKNAALIKRYEKYGAEHYDTFGR